MNPDMTPLENLTPQQKLDATRQAIVRYMTRNDEVGEDGNGMRGRAPDSAPGGSSGTIWKTARRAVITWWRHHPAHMAIDVGVCIAKPALCKYAKEKPAQLLGMAAALGAATVLIRPWRLVSVTGLLLATFKSSGLTPVLLSLISTEPEFKITSEGIPKTG